MNNLTISIFGNKTFFEILNELKLFSAYKIEYFDSLDFHLKDAENKKLIIFFKQKNNENLLNKIKQLDLPLILVTETSNKAFFRRM